MPVLFPNVPAIQFPVVFPGVGVVLPESAGKIVITGKVAFGAKIKIIVVLAIEHGVDDLDGSYPDWTGRETRMFVCVIRRINVHVFVENTSDGKIAEGVLYCGAGVQFHAALEPVDINPGDHRIFFRFCRFLLDDGGESGHFDRREAEFLSLLQPAAVPKPVVFSFHAFQKIERGGAPIHLVRVWQKKCADGVSVKAELGLGRGIVHCGHELLLREIELTGCLFRQFFHGSDIVERERYRLLQSAPEHIDQLIVVHSLSHLVTSWAHRAARISLEFCYQPQRAHVVDTGVRPQ